MKRVFKILSLLLILFSVVYSYVVITQQKVTTSVASEEEGLQNIPFSILYSISNQGDNSTKINLTLPLDTYVLKATACLGDTEPIIVNDDKISCSNGQELNSTFDLDHYVITIYNLSLGPNEIKNISIVGITKGLTYVKVLVRSKEFEGQYKTIIDIINPLNKDLNNIILLVPIDKDFLPDNCIPDEGEELRCDNLISNRDSYILKLNSNYFIVLSFSVIPAQSKVELVGNFKYVQDFKKENWYIEYIDTPIDGEFKVKRFISPLVEKNTIKVLASPFSSISLPFQIKDDGISTFIETTLPLYYGSSAIFPFKKETFNLSGFFYPGKKTFLTLFRMDEVDFQNEFNKSFSEAGIVTKSGYIYVYNGTWDDENEGNTTLMVWEDKNTANEYDTLLIDENKNHVFNELNDLVLNIEENKSNINIYTWRTDEKYSYIIFQTPSVNNTQDDQVNITFYRLPKSIFNPQLKGVIIYTPKNDVKLFNETNYLIFQNNVSLMYLNNSFSDYVDSLDDLNISDKVSLLSPNVAYPSYNYEFFKILAYNQTSLLGYFVPKTGEDVYFGKIKIFVPSKNKYELKDALLKEEGTSFRVYSIKNYSKRYDLQDENNFDLLLDFKYKPLFVLGKDTILRYNYYPVEGEPLNYYIITLNSLDIKPIKYYVDYKTSIENVTTSQYYSISSKSDVYEWDLRITTTVPMLLDRVIRVPFIPSSFECYKDGEMVSLKKVEDSIFRILTPLEEGRSYNIDCYFYRNTNDVSADLVEDITKGKYEKILYYVDVKKPYTVRIEFPLKVNQIPDKICLNNNIDSDCDQKIEIDLFKYKYSNSYLIGFTDIYLSQPKYVKIVLENVENPISYQLEKNFEIRKNIINNYVNLYVKNERDINLPFSQLSFLLNEEPLSILEIKGGEMKEVTNKVKINKISNKYQYIFKFSDYILNVLPGLKKMEERQYIIQLKNKNLEVNYVKGSTTGGEYENNTYTIIKKVENKGLDGVHIKLYFDEEPLQFIKEFMPFIVEDDTFFKINYSETPFAIYIEDDIGGKETKEYGLKYIKDKRYHVDLWDNIYTDLSIIFDKDLRDDINGFAEKRENDYLLKGKKYIKKIDELIKELVNLIKRNKKPTADNTSDSVFYGIGLVNNFNWDDILNSKDYLISYPDYEKIKDIKDDLKKEIKDFLDYVDNVGKLEDALDSLKNCLQNHVDNREYCYNKYEILNPEVRILENCFNNYLDDKTLSDTELTTCLQQLVKFEKSGTNQVNQQTNPNNNQNNNQNTNNNELLNSINDLINNILLKITNILTNKEEYAPQDIERVNNIKNSVEEIRDKIKRSNNDKDTLNLFKNQLLNFLNILDSIKPNPLLPNKKELKDKIQKVVDDLQAEFQTIDFPSDDQLLNLNDDKLLNKYTELKSKLQEIIQEINNKKDDVDRATSEKELNTVNSDIQKKKIEFENIKQKLLNVITQIKNKLRKIKTSQQQKPIEPIQQPKTTPVHKETTKKEERFNPFILVIPLLILAGLGAGVFYYFKKIKPKKKSSEQEGNKEEKDNKEEPKEETKEEEKKEKILSKFEEPREEPKDNIINTNTSEEVKDNNEEDLSSILVSIEEPQEETNLVKEKPQEGNKEENDNKEEPKEENNKNDDETNQKLKEVKEKLKKAFAVK